MINYRISLSGLVAVFGWVACAKAPHSPSAGLDAIQRLARSDPAFAGGESVAARLTDCLFYQPSGEATERARFLAQVRTEHDELAERLARDHVDEATAEAALVFLATDAGVALVRAEHTALCAYLLHGDDFCRELLELLGQPERVGVAATGEVVEANRALTRGASVSPQRLALLVAVQGVQPKHAREIARFAASEEGSRWHEARAIAFQSAQQRALGVHRKALTAGFLAERSAADQRLLPSPLPSTADPADLILPRATEDRGSRRKR